MVQKGIEFDEYTFGSIIKNASKLNSSSALREFGNLLSNTTHSNAQRQIVSNAIVLVYAKNNQPQNAINMLDQMEKDGCRILPMTAYRLLTLAIQLVCSITEYR